MVLFGPHTNRLPARKHLQQISEETKSWTLLVMSKHFVLRPMVISIAGWAHAIMTGIADHI
jgi:hypothetical protein